MKYQQKHNQKSVFCVVFQQLTHKMRMNKMWKTNEKPVGNFIDFLEIYDFRKGGQRTFSFFFQDISRLFHWKIVGEPLISCYHSPLETSSSMCPSFGSASALLQVFLDFQGPRKSPFSKKLFQKAGRTFTITNWQIPFCQYYRCISKLEQNSMPPSAKWLVLIYGSGRRLLDLVA